MLRSVFIPFFLLFSIHIFAQDSYKKALQKYRTNYLPEKVFLHTDKDVYAAGETIWGAVYLVDGQTHRLGAFSNTVHVELVDAEQTILKEAKIFLKEGRGTLSLEIPTDLQLSNYQLRAYANYQQNAGSATLFRKTIAVVSGLQDISQTPQPIQTNLAEQTTSSKKVALQFFPEGGDCVAGLTCKTALIAKDQSNQPVAVSGQIYDQAQKVITFFETNAQGMGQFTYVPEPNQDYEAKTKEGDQSFSLPTSLEKGYTLNVYQRGDSMSILLNTNLSTGLKNAHIVVHHRGLPFIEEALTLTENKTVVPIKKEDLLPGVYVATLFDPTNHPVAERLFFIAPKKENTILDIGIDSDIISTRQEVKVSVKDLNSQGIANDSLLASDLSLSVLPKVANVKSVEDIRTWFLLNSDLDVPVQDAGEILFQVRPSARDYLMDQFLMTRGWRRFRWKEMLANSSFQAPYKLEQGLFVSGQLIKQGTENKPQRGKVFLNQMEYNIHEETITDDNGNFSFGPYVLYDTTTFILQGRFKRGKKNKKLENISFEDNNFVDISITSMEKPQLPLAPLRNTNALAVKLKKYENLSQEILTIIRNYEALTIDLDVVDIRAKRITQKEKQRKERSFFYNGQPSNRLVIDDFPELRNAPKFINLLERLPGVNVFGDKIHIAGGPTSFLLDTEPLFILETAQITKETALNLPVIDVEFIDLLRGSDASIYGSRGSNGVVLIYTRKTYDWERIDRPVVGLKRINLKGYHKAREYAVIDLQQQLALNRPDVRTTLHWNPTLLLPKNGKITEAFVTSDQKGAFMVMVQGLRKNGMPLFGSAVFEVN